MNKFLKRLFIASVFLFTSAFAFSDDWYVCLASFSQLENAKNFSNQLTQKKVPSGIAETYVSGKHMYRVVLKEESKTIEQARAKRDEFQSSELAESLNLKGLWVCQALAFLEESEVFDLPPETEKTESPVESPSENPDENQPEENIEVPEEVELQTPVVLTANESEEIPLSEEKPFSVKIRSYKEEQNALRDKNRLKEQEIDSYILKTYDEESFFNFALHAGAFESEEESEELQQKLEDLGIEDTEVSDYNDIADSIEKYNEVVENQNVTYEDGNNTYPGTFAFYVKECIRQFPINRDYQIEEAVILDMDNINELSSSPADDLNEIDVLEDYFNEESEIHAISFAKYNDDLYNRTVTVAIALGDKNSFVPEEDIEDSFEYKFLLQNGVLNSVICPDDEDYYLIGINDDSDMLIFMKAENFETKDDFISFLNNTKNDSSLLVYPQIRKTLAILPDENPDVERNFLMFRLSQIQESYAAERSYSNWSQAIVGHWNAEGFFMQNNTLSEIGFFDMDYDYNAKKVHQMFMDSRTENPFAYLYESINHAVDYDKAEAWYSGLGNDSNELSFSTGSYIVAIDSMSPDFLSEAELIEIADDLKIWKSE